MSLRPLDDLTRRRVQNEARTEIAFEGNELFAKSVKALFEVRFPGHGPTVEYKQAGAALGFGIGWMRGLGMTFDDVRQVINEYEIVEGKIS